MFFYEKLTITFVETKNNIMTVEKLIKLLQTIEDKSKGIYAGCEKSCTIFDIVSIDEKNCTVFLNLRENIFSNEVKNMVNEMER